MSGRSALDSTWNHHIRDIRRFAESAVPTCRTIAAAQTAAAHVLLSTPTCDSVTPTALAPPTSKQPGCNLSTSPPGTG
jgi:predicted secreted Zn-dependent protease